MLLGMLGLSGASQARSEAANTPGTSGLFVAGRGLRVAPGQVAFATMGYAVVGCGAARYVLSQDSGVAPWRVQVADGRWFELAEPQPDTYMFGGVGDGVHDDTAAILAQHDYCRRYRLPMLLPVPPVTWRTTATIESRVGMWRGLGERVRWRFDPPDSETQDMRACLELREGVRSIVENLDFEGPHHYNPADPVTYVRDAARGPQAADGGWYDAFFKPGCCAIRVTASAQPIFRNVWTSGNRAGSFKVGICLDTDAGHVEVGSGCSHFDLIGVRVVRNADDYKFRGEPVITNGFCGILFGTSNLNGSANGGLGLRDAEFYIGACPYGILQMHDHGAPGTPLSNPHYPIEGVYGTLDGSFFEFIGEAAVQTLPRSICRDLTYSDMERFSWESRFALPTTLIAADRKQSAPFRFGQLSRNCRFGTVRSKPSYVSSQTRHPDACSLLFHFSDADPSTVVARPLLETTRVLASAPGASLHIADGRAVHAGDMVLASEFLCDGNLLQDPLSPASWERQTANIAAASDKSSLPAEMRLELTDDPLVITLASGNHSLPFARLPETSVIGVESYITAWINVPAGSALFQMIIDDPTSPARYAFTSPPTGGWTRLALGGGMPLNAAARRLEIAVSGAPLRLAGLMASVGRRRAFNRNSGPTASRMLRAGGGLTVNGQLAVAGVGTTSATPPSGKAGALPVAPTGYLSIIVDGVPRWLPYY